MKKIIFLQILLSFLSFANIAKAEVAHLQLAQKSENIDTSSDMQKILLFGEAYINDVKKYNEELAGDKIDEDFRDDIVKHHLDYDQEQVDAWQKYVRNGVKIYRRYIDIKNKIVEFLLHDEIPLVVDDDQYEMGENEEYIPTDEPLVIKDFKKVVAYSNNKRDIDAANEKLAKDYNLESPAKVISRYKKAILNRDWKTLFGFSIKDEIKKHNEKLMSQSDLNDKNLRATILTEKQGVDSDVVRWLVAVETKEDAFVLFDDYKNYEGIRVDASRSQNLKDIKFGFNMPEEAKVSEFDSIVGWRHRFPIYFEGIVVDANKDVGLDVALIADVCYDVGCKRAKANPKAKLVHEKESRKTLYAASVDMMAYNIPKDENAKYFKFGKAVWEDGEDLKNIRFEVKTNKPELLKIIPIGKEGKDLGRAQLSIVDGSVVVRFKWKNNETTPVGKTIVFWVAGDNNRQYFHAAKIEELSVFDVEGGKFSLGILGLAFIGGVLLNFMPCVFPVLFLKLLAFTKFGGLNVMQIRRNFTCNSLGILFSFAIMAIILAVLKAAGVALGWGMQFQNVYFMCFIIWLVFIFFMMLLGLIRFDSNRVIDKILSAQKKGMWFEFLSGVFLVMLSTPCVAPYLGTVFGVALTSNAKIILLTVMVVGLGLAFPYMLIAFVPQIAFAMPKPGKWLNKIDLLMRLLLVVTMGWLISVLSAQTSTQQVWHWVGYLIFAFVLLFIVYAYKKEIDKEADRESVKICCKNADIFAFVCMLGLFVWSVIDARTDYMENMQKREKITVKEIDVHEIKRNLALGNKMLVKVGADWCLTCKYNDVLIFNTEYIGNMIKKENVKIVDVDWTNYQEDVLKFMQKFGRTGLPFYVFFSPKYSEGIVLDEMIKDFELKNILEL